jgi:hypothetical protein
MKHLKINLKLQQFPFKIFLNSPSLCSVKSQLAWANRPNAAWKRVKGTPSEKKYSQDNFRGIPNFSKF